jgi:signal peptide peptidase SppA
MSFPNILGQIFNRPMLATPELLNDAVFFARAHLGISVSSMDGLSLSVSAPRVAGYDPDGDGDGQGDNDSDGDGSGVAQISVSGPLVARAGNLKMCQVMTAYESVERQVSAAVADPSISRIVLDIDSNGGDATGAFELADSIRAANLIKPVHAIVHYRAFSGGYLLAAAAGEVSVSQSSGVGSIGVIAKHVDLSKALENEGVKVTTAYRGARKADLSPDAPLTDGAMAALNQQLDRIYSQFTNSIAGFRNTPVQSVVGTDAGLYFGQDAIDVGLADRLETPNEAINRIAGLARADRAKMATKPAPSPTFSASAKGQSMKMAAEAMEIANSL